MPCVRDAVQHIMFIRTTEALTTLPSDVLQEPDAAIFIHIGMTNPRGAWSATKSMVRALGQGKYCQAYYTFSDGHLDPRIGSLLRDHGVIH